MRFRHRIATPVVQVTLIILALPGLAALLDRVSLPYCSQQTLFVIRLFTFGSFGFLLLRERSTAVVARWSDVVALAMLAAVVRFAPSHLQPAGFVLFAATIEELVFRKYLVIALRVRLSGVAGTIASMLLAQVVFAVCHFVVRGHPAAFGDAQLFARLFAAGCFLAVIYQLCGLLPAILLHFVVNGGFQGGSFAGFILPTYFAVVCLSLGGVLGVVLVAFLRPNRRTPHVRECSTTCALAR